MSPRTFFVGGGRLPVVSSLDATAARECVEREHADVLAAVASCADAVAETWGGDSTPDADAVASRLESCLAERDVLARFPGVLSDAVTAAGGELQADPVAGPPYAAVTSRGPVLRATLDGGRLVVELAVFRVTDDARYERTGDVAVNVAVR